MFLATAWLKVATEQVFVECIYDWLEYYYPHFTKEETET